jgi:hypothetical protein
MDYARQCEGRPISTLHGIELSRAKLRIDVLPDDRAAAREEPAKPSLVDKRIPVRLTLILGLKKSQTRTS